MGGAFCGGGGGVNNGEYCYVQETDLSQKAPWLVSFHLICRLSVNI